MNGYTDESLDPYQPPAPTLRKIARTWPVVLIVSVALFTAAGIHQSPAFIIEALVALLAAIWLFAVWDRDDHLAWQDATVMVAGIAVVLVAGAALWAWVGAV